MRLILHSSISATGIVLHSQFEQSPEHLSSTVVNESFVIFVLTLGKTVSHKTGVVSNVGNAVDVFIEKTGSVELAIDDGGVNASSTFFLRLVATDDIL
jgi:hypothetical protein